MLVHVDFAVLLQLFCIVQGLTTGLYLLIAKPRREANTWLGLLLLGLTLQVVDYFLSRSGVYYRHRWLYFTPLFFSWTFGPLLWAWVRTRAGLPRPRWVHFGPGAVQLLFYFVLAVQSFDAKTYFWLNIHKPVTRYLEYYGAIGLLLAYLVPSLRLVSRPHARAPWLRRGLWGLGVFYVVAALDPLINARYLPAGAPTFYLTSLVLPGVAYGAALFGWLQSRTGPDPAQSAATGRLALAAASTAALPPAPAVGHRLARVVQALAQERLYRNPGLTLDDLARHLGLTPNGLSQTINAGLQQSFSDVVNGYRLAEVKQRLLTADARRLTVLALALEAGFNSKTTFNRVFKEKTGMTPKEYQKRSHSTHWDDSVPAPG